jgi:PAS domain S-box-containing protein
MKLSLERQIPMAFLAALILLVTISFFSYRQITALSKAVMWEKHTQEVLQQLDGTLALVVDAETSGRGFIISGNEDFLEPYNHTNQVIAENLQKLKDLTADNAGQTQKVAQLETLIYKRIDLIKQFTDIRRTEGLSETLAQTTGRGKDTMDAIRSTIAQMKNVEKNILVEREAELDSTISGTYRILILGSIAGIFSLGLANLAIFRETGKRSRAEENLRVANRDLEKRVSERTNELSVINEQLKEVIKKRRESEDRHRMALEAGALGTWKLSLDGDDGEMDERSLNVFGLSPKDFQGTSKNAFDRIIEEDTPQVEEKFRRAFLEKTKFEAEFRIRDNKNSIRWNQCTGSPQFDEKGDVTHLIGFCRDITEVKEAELALRRSESFVRTTLDSLPAHIAVLDEEGTIVETNRAWNNFATANCIEEKISLTGIGQNYLRVCENSEAFEEATADILKNLRAVLKGEQKDFSYEYPCHSPTEERWFLMLVSRMGDGAVVSHIDISARKRSETELRNSEEFNRSIFENSPDCVKILNLDGTLEAMNTNGMCIMEIDDFMDFKGKIWTDFWSGDENKKAIEAVESAKSGKTGRFEGYTTTAKGNLKYWDVTVAPIFDSQGKPRRIISTSRDITERQSAEKSKAYLAALVESSDDAIVSKDLNGIITSWNKGAESLFGYKADEAVGRSVMMLIPPQYVGEELQIINSIRQGKKVVLFETVRRRKDKSLVEVSLTVSPILDGDGKVIGASKIAHDITERKQAEREREKLLEREQAARKEAEIATRLRDEFLATVSHELRAPLNAILGWSRLLQQNRLDEKSAPKALQTIVRNAEAQSRLIEDLLDVSRIISGKLRLEVMPVKPIFFVEAALETVRPAAEAKNISFEVQEDSEVSHISGDPNRLQQVVWNLLSNAIKFTPNDGKVSVAIKRKKSHVEISVKDTGVGIKPEFLPHVFDRFSQADASSIRKFGGLGLGLAIVRHLTEMHGGTVRVESEGENKGSVFTVELPLIASPKDEEISVAVNPVLPEIVSGLSLDGLLILVVDDEEDTRQLMVQTLTHYGATVITANSAASALQAVENQNPDVLVSDIGMPDEDGYSLIRKVRAQDIEIPAVALTAFTRAQDRMRALSAGFQNHVAKPVEPEELVTVIASLTGRLQMNDE